MPGFRSKAIISRGVEKLGQSELKIGEGIFVIPKVVEWVEKLVEDNNPKAVCASSLGFSRINDLFPSDFLSKVRVVAVDGITPWPPLVSCGLSKFKKRDERRKIYPARGVVFKDIVFIRKKDIGSEDSEDLLFHELVHVVQWEKLGAYRFMIAYCEGFYNYGYRGNPLEEIAYDLKMKFINGNLPDNFIECIESDAAAIWNGIEPKIQGLKGSGDFPFLQDLKPL